MELKDRIFKARSDAKMTQADLAAAVGKTRAAVAQWESGDVRPRHATLVSIAAATGKNLVWLLHGGVETDPMRPGLRVVGEVAAGTWREGNLFYEQTIQPVAPHPDYPLHAQRLYRVVGTSIDRVAKSGEYLHTVSVKDTDIKPESGDLVIVRRSQHGMSEYTAKQLVWKSGAWFLRPESTDPEWQADLSIDVDEGVDVEIVDIVVGKWAPIARRRPIAQLRSDPFTD